MKKIILIILSGLLLIGISGCNKENDKNDKISNNINVSEKLDTIINMVLKFHLFHLIILKQAKIFMMNF